jgi:hypothetical protein
VRYGDALAWDGAPAIGFATVLLAVGVAGGWIVALDPVAARR